MVAVPVPQAIDVLGLVAADLAFDEAIVAYYTGQTADGAALLEKAAQLDPKFAMPAYARGFYMLLGATPGGLEGATRAFARCLEQFPTSTSCLEKQADVGHVLEPLG